MYDELFDAWMEEKNKSALQKLSPNFYDRLLNYVKRIREERRMLDDKTIRGRLIEKEEENVTRLTEELVSIRYKKIWDYIHDGGSPPSSLLTHEEINLFSKTLDSYDSYRDLAKSLLHGQTKKRSKSGPKGFKVVRFIREMPQLIGADLKTYGPFKQDEVATLPDENARNLIKQGIAAEIETQ